MFADRSLSSRKFYIIRKISRDLNFKKGLLREAKFNLIYRLGEEKKTLKNFFFKIAKFFLKPCYKYGFYMRKIRFENFYILKRVFAKTNLLFI